MAIYLENEKLFISGINKYTSIIETFRTLESISTVRNLQRWSAQASSLQYDHCMFQLLRISYWSERSGVYFNISD